MLYCKHDIKERRSSTMFNANYLAQLLQINIVVISIIEIINTAFLCWNEFVISIEDI